MKKKTKAELKKEKLQRVKSAKKSGHAKRSRIAKLAAKKKGAAARKKAAKLMWKTRRRLYGKNGRA